MIVGQIIEGYTIIKQIGQGSYGEVYLVYKNIKTYALKRINKFMLRKQQNGILNQLVNNEINALRIVENDNVVRLIEELDHKDFKSIIMEYCEGGDLQDYVTLNGHLEENVALSFFKQILNGMFGLHEKRIIHRDLKPSNILLHKETILKIADLGFCKQFKDLSDQTVLSLGSFGYMAPEIAFQNSYGIAADMFSIGCILYFMLFGVLPFAVGNHDAYKQSLKEDNVQYERNGIKISQPVEQLLRSTLQIDPRKRITFSQIYESGILQVKVDLTKTGIQRCLLGGNMVNDNVIQKNIQFYMSHPNIDLEPPQNQEENQYIKQILDIGFVDDIKLEELQNQDVRDILSIGISKYNNYLYIYKTYQYMQTLENNDKNIQHLLLILIQIKLMQLQVLFQQDLDIKQTLYITEMYKVNEYTLMLDQIADFLKKVQEEYYKQDFDNNFQYQNGIEIIVEHNKTLKNSYKYNWKDNIQQLILVIYLQNTLKILTDDDTSIDIKTHTSIRDQTAAQLELLLKI